MSKFLKWAELPARTDIHQNKGTTKWGNHDLYPIVEKERTYGKGAFILYWTTCGAGLSTFAIGSSYIAVGLTAGEACGAVLIGTVISSCNALLLGRVGGEKHLGYTMMARVSFGLRGMWLPLFFQILANVIFFGLQAVYGGQAISLMLSAMSPHYKNLKNTLPASAGTTTRDLVGFFIYIITYLPMIVFIKPHKLEKFMWPAFIGTVATVFGIMGWAVAKNGGSPGNLVKPAIALSASARGFRFVQCISSVCGTYGGAADRFADWTRFSRKKNDYFWGSATAMPIVITICALLGVLTASATRAHFGTAMWQPLTILAYAQSSEYTAGCRAATFFAGLAIYSHQVFVNVTQNNVGAGMDLAGVFPRYVSMKRGSIILMVLGVIAQPWRFLTQATIFLSVISSFAVFASVCTAILMLDYWVIRKKMWKVPDLYKGGPEYIYWYTHGINMRAWFTYIVTVIPSLPGLIMSLMGKTKGNAVKIYQITYIFGFVLGTILYFTINKIWPPEGCGIDEPFDESEVEIVEGVMPSVDGSESSVGGKGEGVAIVGGKEVKGGESV
ncbi:permease for cytosine/purines, uracil, thiamine, allantoin-domain-containing protein [Tricladium varicosporioides]|nr:permease for cytosine/purines, uracil, thiamine, allantoin-domain-containing protein [Hymenoscyphus varicosporioides]